MVKKQAKGKKRKKDERNHPSLFETLGHDTVRGVSGVFLFVLATIMTLSALHLAGVAGDTLYAGIYWLVGLGYYLLPVLFIAWALMLFKVREDTVNLQPIRITGASLFFLSTLSIVGVLSPAKAGKVGTLIATPMVHYFETIASLVILGGLTVIALLLLFDSALWVHLAQNIHGLFARVHTKKKDENNMTDTEVLEDTPATLVADEVSENETNGVVDDTQHDEETLEESTPEEEEYMEDVKKKKRSSSPKRKKLEERTEEHYTLPTEYSPPPVSLLEPDRGKANVGDTKVRSNLIRKTLQQFKIPVEMDEIVVGPTVTRYSLKPAAGVRLNKIVALQSNLEFALAASPIRIEAPIPGKSLVGIEVPNTKKMIVGLSSLLSSPEFVNSPNPLTVALGKDITGKMHYADLGSMPHLLVAGATGTGKSVMIHTLILSLLYRNGPEQLHFILVDPKRVELTLYKDIPHLRTPVITDPKKAILALKWAAKEMERRYDILQENEVRDLGEYYESVVMPAQKVLEKQKSKGKNIDDFELPEPLPNIVIVIDELADLMSAYPRELEAAIVRLAQKSRAVGIHLILSTQRPEVKVVTGLIKANVPARIALKVTSVTNSHTILEQAGAEKLLGHGDILYLGGNMAKPHRIQSPLVTSKEVGRVAKYLKKHNDYELHAALDFYGDEGGDGGGIPFDEMEQNDAVDERFNEVLDVILEKGVASASFIQRRFRMGYSRAANIMDQFEQYGFIPPSDGTNKPRRIDPKAVAAWRGETSDSEDAYDNEDNEEWRNEGDAEQDTGEYDAKEYDGEEESVDTLVQSTDDEEEEGKEYEK